MDITDHIKKIRVSKEGKILEGELPRSTDSVKKAIDDQETCKLKGYLLFKKVPGNWHISFHATRDLLYGLPATDLNKLKFSHTVNHLSFGQLQEYKEIYRTFGRGDSTNFSPFNGYKMEQTSESPTHFEYYVHIIPVQYENQRQEDMAYGYHFDMNAV